MMKRIILCLALLAATPATAACLSEVLEARRKCQEISEKLASTQSFSSLPFSKSITSNYSIKTQRCYAKIDTRGEDIESYLYDAPTGEFLAHTTVTMRDGNIIRSDGFVGDEYYDSEILLKYMYPESSNKSVTAGYLSADAYIRMRMDPAN